jgi:hypothetical protein
VSTIACGICERPIANAPSDAGPVLCPACAAHPELVRAFREGFARGKADAEADAERGA